MCLTGPCVEFVADFLVPQAQTKFSLSIIFQPSVLLESELISSTCTHSSVLLLLPLKCHNNTGKIKIKWFRKVL